jgi:hypothetical protein
MDNASVKIPIGTVEDIHRTLRDRGVQSWGDITWEYQDDFEYVLFVIQLKAIPLHRNAPDRMYVYDLFNSRIPPKPNGDDSWMVVFEHNDAVCDSLFKDNW